MINIFDNPQKYIDELYKRIKIDNYNTYNGKSMAVVFLTKFCPVECPFCFFRSKNRKNENVSEKNEFSNQGAKKLVSEKDEYIK